LHYFRSLACVTVCSFLACAQTNIPALPVTAANPQTSVPQPTSAQPTSWLTALWNLPIFRFFAPFVQETDPVQSPSQPDSAVPVAELPPCTIAPLPAITDADALDFEASVGSSAVVDTDDLMPTTAKALTHLQSLVDKAGGTVVLKSAYRPPAYQAHLQAVWDKWEEVRDNQQPECHDLRASVEQEFTGHHLILTQRPVNSSDHTRGLAFDALVSLPSSARLNRRSVTQDSLARLSGVRRVDILHDPVHFKFVGAARARRA